MVYDEQAYGDAYRLRKSSEMISSVNPYFIILPIVLAQYILATFALVRLARARLSTPRYVLWNVFIVVVFFVGSITFFIYDAVRKKPAQEDGDETALPKDEALAEPSASQESEKEFSESDL